MTASVQIYGMLERVLGRRFVWRLGRWLYQGARRELANNPAVNGEYALQRWVADALRQIDISRLSFFVDVGANVGSWTAHLVETLRSKQIQDCRIHAFEPASAQRRTMEGKLAGDIANGSVVIDPRGVGDRLGHAAFVITGSESGTNFIVPNGVGCQIELVTLDEWATTAGLDEIVLVKVDTEGNDLNVIRGARKLLQSRKIGILQFEYVWLWMNFGHTLRDVFDLAAEVGYSIGRFDGRWY